MPTRGHKPEPIATTEWDWPARRGTRTGRLRLVEPSAEPPARKQAESSLRTVCLVTFVLLGELAVVYGLAAAVYEIRGWLLPIPGALTAISLYLTAQHAQVAEQLGARRRLLLACAVLLGLVSVADLVLEVRSTGPVELKPVRFVRYPVPRLPEVLERAAPAAADLVATPETVLAWGANSVTDLQGNVLLAADAPIDHVFACGAAVVVSAGGAIARLSVRTRRRISRWAYPSVRPDEVTCSGDSLFVASRAGTVVERLDAARLTPTGTLSFADRVTALGAGLGRLFVSTNATDDIAVVDPRLLVTSSVLQNVPETTGFLATPRGMVALEASRACLRPLDLDRVRQADGVFAGSAFAGGAAAASSIATLDLAGRALRADVRAVPLPRGFTATTVAGVPEGYVALDAVHHRLAFVPEATLLHARAVGMPAGTSCT